MLSEFDLIAKYFTRTPRHNGAIALGVGDDCALLTPTPGTQLAISSDMLVEARHFFSDVDPRKLGHKCLAVNLSDLAAMGAKPIAFTLALSLPTVNEQWLAPFAEGLLGLADQYQCELIGGDTTQGPLTICITIFGEVPNGAALRRDGAQAGDDIWVSGSLGDARLALAGYRDELTLDHATLEHAAQRLHSPSPRVEFGLALRGIAHSAIDISDGLIGDLGHILTRSNLGATLNADALPVGAMLQQQPRTLRHQYALAGGDDYELCFTAAPTRHHEVQAAAQQANIAVTRIGTIDTMLGLRLTDASGAALESHPLSFDHFRT